MPVVRAPASTANLGPGFDVLGMALSLHTEAATHGNGPPCDPGHPAARAYAAAGGRGDLWVRSAIPSGRGLGFSGSARVAGALVALVAAGADPDDARAEALRVAAEHEGHADNAGASVYGGVVVATDAAVVPLPVRLETEVVVWIPDHESDTDRSRRALPATVDRADAVFNVGRTALLVAALLAGEPGLLADATQDRLHQPHRLAALPASAAAIDAAVVGGAWGAWLSGSGPSVAALAAPGTGQDLATRLPAGGRTMVLALDTEGAVVVEP